MMLFKQTSALFQLYLSNPSTLAAFSLSICI
jgi:hypothetical protein